MLASPTPGTLTLMDGWNVDNRGLNPFAVVAWLVVALSLVLLALGALLIDTNLAAIGGGLLALSFPPAMILSGVRWMLRARVSSPSSDTSDADS